MEETSKNNSNLAKRVISGAILAPVVILAIWAGDFVYASLVLLASLIMAFEWFNMVHSGENQNIGNKNKWQFLGVLYVASFALSLFYLRHLPNGFAIIMFVCSIVWTTDIAAYFCGKKFGGPKIYVKISPNKTWAGLFGGMLFSTIVGLTWTIFTDVRVISILVFIPLLSALSQVGDFFESWVKRKFGIKDTSKIIPGHGGLLDRVDGLVPVVVLFAIYALITGGIN